MLCLGSGARLRIEDQIGMGTTNSGESESASPGEDGGIQRLNSSFYSADPADYIFTRLQLLLLAGGRQDDLERLWQEGLEFGALTVGPTVGGQDLDEPKLERFLLIESQQLLHHAAETVLRIFLVHTAGVAVPWIELAGERSFSNFKKRVQKEFLDGVPRPETIGHVCLGHRVRPEEIAHDEWYGAIEGLQAFLRTFAQLFLEQANLYNAIKHGLGVSAGNASLVVAGHQMGQGNSVEFPESTNWKDGSRTWSLTTYWPDINYSLGLIYIAVQTIESIWGLGAHRRVGRHVPERLFMPTTLRPVDLMSPSRAPAERMSMQVLEERRPAPSGGRS